MKMFRFGVVAFAILAFSAMGVAATASATVTFLLALWLGNGAVITANTAAVTTGELELENTNAPIVGNAGVLCSGVLDGFVGPESFDEVTELLSLTGTAISLTALTGTSLSCSNILNCESAKVWAVHLPWTSELELYVDGTEEGFVILLKSAAGTVGWYIECTDLGIKASEECTTATGAAKATNAATGAEGAFTDAFTLLMELPLALCSGSGTETGEVRGTGLETIATGGPLSVSE